MAINSFGYPGSIGSADWAKMAESLGEKYGVQDYADWRVTPVVGPDRTVAVAAGTGFGRGVLDVNTAPVQIQLDAGTGANGTVRYDLIVARRTWGVTNATVFTKINGTTSTAGPPRLVGAGTQDDQVLALVKITTGSTVPVIDTDLRTFPSKVIVAADLRALVDATYGDQAKVGPTLYQRGLDASNNPVWQVVQAATNSYTPTFNTDGTQGSVGSTGSLKGVYSLANGWCDLAIYFGFGNSNGGNGAWRFGYPPGVVPDTSVIAEWWGVCKPYVPNGGNNQLPGVTWFRPAGIYPYVQLGLDNSDQYAIQNADATTGASQAGTSIPRAPGIFTWDSGANLFMGGRFKYV